MRKLFLGALFGLFLTINPQPVQADHTAGLECKFALTDDVQYCLWENPGSIVRDILCLIIAVEDYGECSEEAKTDKEEE